MAAFGKNVDNYNKMGSENVNQISYPMLNKMVKERGIKRVTISKAIGITEQTLTKQTARQEQVQIRRNANDTGTVFPR